MTMISTISDKRSRCPHCRARAAVQSTIELMPGVRYLTLRCISCATIYAAQVPSNPTLATALASRIECA
jgi:transcription elongation factor Elf1